MNISWLTLRDLEYLVEAGRQMHFGKAAEACHVSQPALSAQIRKVEEFLGFSIFERTNRKVALTPRGRRVVEQARVVLEEAQKILTGSSDRSLEPLHMGIISTLGPYYVPHFLPLLRTMYPQMQLVLREGLTAQLIMELKSGALDVLLAAAGTFDSRGLRVFPVFAEPFVLALPKKHLLTKKKMLRPGDLKGSEMVLLEDGHCLREQALEICPRNRRGSIRQYHATSLETLKALVASGLGYTLIPLLAVDKPNRLRGLISYRNFESRIGRDIVMVCRDRYPEIGMIEQLVKLLRSSSPKASRHYSKSQ